MSRQKLWLLRAALLAAFSPAAMACIYGIILNAGDSSTQDGFAIALACVIFMVFMAW